MTDPPLLIPPASSIFSIAQFPSRFYPIFLSPAPLAGCEFPFSFRHWDSLHAAGFRHVVCLSSETPRYSPAPLRFAVACELDDLAERKRPVKPAQEAKAITAIAKLIVTKLEAGEGVLVHCAAGRGRTGAVIGVVLRMLGHSAETVIDHLDQLHHVRSGKGWPESKWQSDLLRRDYVSGKRS